MIVNRSKAFLSLFATCALFLVPVRAHAATVSIGTLSFDTFIPSAPGSPGINAFNLSNLTGSFSLPPDFPVMDDLTFQGATLTLNPVAQEKRVLHLGDIGPGFLLDSDGNPVMQVPSNQDFASAEFTAMLSALVFNLSDGTSFAAGSTAIDVLLLPSAGQVLEADTDQATITASTAPQTTVPEPASWQVVLLVLPWFMRRLRR